MSKARELAELSRTVSDSADATAITINSDEEVTFASGVTVTGALSATGTSVFASLDISGDIDVAGVTNLDVVDIDGAVDMASTLGVTGVATLASLVATTADINGGTIDGTVIGGTTAAAGSFTTGSFSETTFVGLTARPAGVPATAGRLWAAQNETGNYGIVSKASTTDSFTYIGNTGTKATLGQSYGSTGSYLPLVLQTSDIDRLTISAAGAATFSGVVTANAGIVVDTMTLDAATLTATGDFTVDAVGDIILDADTGVWRFKDAGTTLYQIAIDGASVVLYTGVSDAAMVFKGNDGGSTVTALTLDMSAAGAATFNAGATFGSGIDVTGTVTADGGLIEGSTGLTIRNDAVGANEPKLVFDNDTFAGATYGQIQTGNGGLQLLIESPSTSTFQNRHQLLLNGGGSTDVTFKLSTDNGTSYKNQLQINNNDISFYEDTGTTPKLTWSATNERLTLTGSDYQFNIQQGANQPWYTRAVSDGTFRLHLNGTGDIITASATGIDVTGAATFSGALTTTSGMTVSAVNAIYNATGTTGWSGYGTTNNGGGVIIGLDDGATFGNAIGTAIIRHSAGKDFVIKRDTTDELRINGSTGAATFSGTVTANGLFASNASGGNVASFTNTSDADLSIFLTSGVSLITPSTGILAFGTSSTERMRIDANSNVGINNSNPSAFDSLGGKQLVVGNGVNTSSLTLFSDDTADGNGYGHVAFADSAVSSSTAQYAGLIQYYHGEDSMRFYTNATQKMRIDASGNLLVGKTATTLSVAGTYISAAGSVGVTRASDDCLTLNRTGNDGAIASFYKDGTTVGSIGSISGVVSYINLDPRSGGTGIAGTNTDSIIPVTGTGAVADGTKDLGLTTARWRNLYLSGASLAGAGSAASPSISFSGDTNTGLYSSAADNIGFATGGTARAFMSATQFNMTGNGVFSGSISKGSGSFKIDHPLPEKAETHHLVHSFVESPQADNIYRGKVDLVDGSATVNIDDAAGMTEGTYVLLNTNTQCFTSNESGWTAVKGSVSGNILTITAQESCSDTISWMVVGERHDQHMLDTEWTDENGKVIVEPLKELEGDAP
jgi:hypothetical protein